jgi:hypothetical protein
LIGCFQFVAIRHIALRRLCLSRPYGHSDGPWGDIITWFHPHLCERGSLHRDVFGSGGFNLERALMAIGNQLFACHPVRPQPPRAIGRVRDVQRRRVRRFRTSAGCQHQRPQQRAPASERTVTPGFLRMTPSRAPCSRTRPATDAHVLQREHYPPSAAAVTTNAHWQCVR